MYASIYLSIYYIYLSFFLSLSPRSTPSRAQSIRCAAVQICIVPSLGLSICLYIPPSIYLSIDLYLYLYIYIYIYLSLSIKKYIYIHVHTILSHFPPSGIPQAVSSRQLLPAIIDDLHSYISKPSYRPWVRVTLRYVYVNIYVLTLPLRINSLPPFLVSLRRCPLASSSLPSSTPSRTRRRQAPPRMCSCYSCYRHTSCCGRRQRRARITRSFSRCLFT